jgi:alanyl-tRNA synthetase
VTERLYLRDPYVTEFEADVLERITTADGQALVFGATYFYPESGGQPYDLGTIDGIPVLRVVEAEDEIILHFVESLPDPDRARVDCRIDAARRRDHMQQHSGQHILSAAFVKEAGAQTTSFHLGAELSTIDLDRGDLSESEIERAERAANDVVRRALPIHSRFVASSDARSLDLRKPPPDVETLRLVEVEGFDNQACCGTHPRTSSEVGPIVVRGLERFKQGTRVQFLCGDRALRDYHGAVSRVRELASVLSSSEADLVSTAEHLQEERKSMAKELGRVKGALLRLGVEEWMSEAERVGELELLVKIVDAVAPSELRSAATELAGKPGRVVLLGTVADGRAHLVFACSEGAPADMNALLQRSLEAVEGRGGGSPRVAQGGGPRTDGLSLALDHARKALPLS